MTRDEFHRRFQGRMLVLLTEAWACRKSQPSELGMLMDNHARQLRELRNEMYDALVPPLAATNGQPLPSPTAKPMRNP